MPSYPFQKQVHIVVGTMTIHNFIRRHPSRSDTDFSIAYNEDLTVNEEPSEIMIGLSVPEDENEFNEFEVHDTEGVVEMAALREMLYMKASPASLSFLHIYLYKYDFQDISYKQRYFVLLWTIVSVAHIASVS
ncbi:uncharacterized protein LOC110037948 [Phalaenopsis equestris]|uniref:uncharacterized protein LOC110037948 n=1 Tax=Phalaenopsis equestris TaxID=78828 RepID=UPI0009E6578B|nr:uncharacterized protein LOC110037948 [Phalaenopsis equestris]